MKAEIVIDKTREGFKAIVTREDSDNRFYPSYPNIKEECEIEKANIDELYSYLILIGIQLAPHSMTDEMVLKVANKFYKELCTQTDLYWDEVKREGFFKRIDSQKITFVETDLTSIEGDSIRLVV